MEHETHSGQTKDDQNIKQQKYSFLNIFILKPFSIWCSSLFCNPLSCDVHNVQILHNYVSSDYEISMGVSKNCKRKQICLIRYQKKRRKL